LARDGDPIVAIRKRYFQLCSGPFKGRILSPGTPDYLLAARAGAGTRMRFAVPASRLDESASAAGRAANPDLVHVYEAFDLVDEISMEIILCKYIGTHPRLEPAQN
jgi:hypothetical protein